MLNLLFLFFSLIIYYNLCFTFSNLEYKCKTFDENFLTTKCFTNFLNFDRFQQHFKFKRLLKEITIL